MSKVSTRTSLALALSLGVLLAGTRAEADAIRCGGVDCSKLRIVCTGPDPCFVQIIGEGIAGPFNVAVTRTHDEVRTTEVVVLDRIGDVSIRTGSGDDAVSFDDSHVGGNLRISTGRGDDIVSTMDWGVRGHRARIDTGPGNDLLFFDAPGWGDVFRVATGDGDDEVYLTQGPPSEGPRVAFDGGAGDDFLSVAALIGFPAPPTKRFETVLFE